MVQIIDRPDTKPTYEELEAEIKRKDQLLDHIWSAATNNGMSAAYARTYIVLALNHPKEVLAGESFDFRVSEIQRLACVSEDTSTKFFRDMSAVGKAEYSCPPVKNSEDEDGKGQFTRQSTIKLLPGSEQANTKASPNRIKEREQETKRREERTAKLNIVPCPHCGCEDEEQLYSALVPVCKSCGKAYQDKSQIIKTKDIRVIEEEVSAESEPAHEPVPASDEPMPVKPLHEDIEPAMDMPSCESEQLTVQPTAIVPENTRPVQPGLQLGQKIPHVCPICKQKGTYKIYNNKLVCMSKQCIDDRNQRQRELTNPANVGLQSRQEKRIWSQ